MPFARLAMTANLSRERLGQLVLTVEALRAGDSSLTAKQVHAALMLDPLWAAVTFRQTRRAVGAANARRPKLSDEERRARRKQQEQKREKQRPRRDRTNRARPAEDRAARERAVLSIELAGDGDICQGQWDPHVQTVPDDMEYCIICGDDYKAGDEVVSLPCLCAVGNTHPTCHWACLDQHCACAGSCPKCRRPMHVQLGDCRQYQVPWYW